MIKNIFWEYRNIDLTNELGMITFLNRKIMFGQFDDKDIPFIKKFFSKLTMTDYRRHYFGIYFKKYTIV